MVIIRTSATEVRTQAVSPELLVHFSRTVAEQLGGAAGAAGALRRPPGRWPLAQQREPQGRRRAPLALRQDYPALRRRARRGQ